MSASSPSNLEHGTGNAMSFTRLALLTLSFQTLGIIYADLGTSPLYTLNGLWPADGPVPSEEDVIGGLSAIVWAITLLPLVKYVFICLRFGTGEGEGGTFALFQGLYPPERITQDSGSFWDRTPLEEKKPILSIPTPDDKYVPKLSPKLRWPLLVWCLFGTSLTLADGIFTPAVSVTSAVAGIAVAKPSVSHDVVSISIAFLIVLFLVQYRGTSQLGFIFAPVTFIWFLLIAITGIYNITIFPGVFRAFDPSRAILLFVRTKNYDILAGVLLALTGCEAMFASLGHFNQLSIRISFSCVVYPSVILAYLGQGARLIVDGETVLPNLFYTTIPGSVNGPLFWVMFVFAILATLIASQTLITASFSLVQQLINMHAIPPLRVVYTSETIRGQVYVPAVNWLLMILTIVVVATFKNPVALTNAFGFSVATVMFSTTILIAIQMRYVKHLPVLVAVAFFLVFGFLDGLFWGAALTKVPEGAWVPLMIGCILLLLMTFWSWAKGLEDELDTSNSNNLHNLILREDKEMLPSPDENNQDVPIEEQVDEFTRVRYYIQNTRDRAAAASEKADCNTTELVRLPTCAVFHRSTVGIGVPPSFIGFVRQWPALPRVVIFLSVRVLPTAHVPAEDQYSIHKIRAIDGFYEASYYLGFRDHFSIEVAPIIERICSIEACFDPRGCTDTIREIQNVTKRSTHIVPHYLLVSKRIGTGKLYTVFNSVFNWFRTILIEEIYRRLATMFPESTNWLGSGEEIIHVSLNAAI